MRLPDIQPLARVRCPSCQRQGIPLFVTGDFNSPSHLDWTPAVADVRPDVPYALSWPVAEALADAGLHDSYRDALPRSRRQPRVHLDARRAGERPGGSRGLRPHRLGARVGRCDDDRQPDRRRGRRARCRRCRSTPYPSDHRAVVSTFTVQPRSARARSSPSASDGSSSASGCRSTCTRPTSRGAQVALAQSRLAPQA